MRHVADREALPGLLLRGGLGPAVAVCTGLAAGSALIGGQEAASVVLGGVLAGAGLSAGPVAMRLARRLPASAELAIALGAYSAVVVILGAAYLALSHAEWVQPRYVAGGAIACTAAWLAGLVRTTAHLRVLTYGDQVEGGVDHIG